MQVSYRGGSPLYFWPNHSLASRASPDVELRPVLLPVETTLLSLFFCLHLFCISLFLPFSLSSILCVSSRSLSCYLPTVAARRSVFFFFFFFSNHSTFPSLYIVASLSSSHSFYVSCPFFSLRPAPSRPVVGKSGAADLLWNLYCYRAPQQWSQPPHFSTPDLCYRDSFHPATRIYFAK